MQAVGVSPDDLAPLHPDEPRPDLQAAAEYAGLVASALTVPQAAARLGVDPSRIRQRLAARTLFASDPARAGVFTTIAPRAIVPATVALQVRRGRVAYELPEVRARIGLIIPSSNRLAEPQLRRYAPAGVETHFTRLRMTGPHHLGLEALLPRVAEAAQTLGDAKCDEIVFHCTAGSMENGPEGERRVLVSIQQATERRAITTATAVMAAFQALGSRRLALITPYSAETNAHEIAFLAQAGLEVARNRPMDLGGSDGYISAPPGLWLRVAQEEADPREDTCFLSCTNIHSLEVIEPLEAALGRPVVASNQAVLWYCLRILGLPDVVPGLGRLARLELKMTERAPMHAALPAST